MPGINQDDMLLYPIPAHDKMELMLNLSKPQSFTATIVDAAGRVVMRWDDSGSGLYTHSIATTPLANGVYYLDIRGAGALQSVLL